MFKFKKPDEEVNASLTSPVSQNNGLVAGAVAGVMLLGSQCSAALTAPTLATTDFETIAGAVIVALGVMWAIKKALGLIRV